MQRMEMLVGAGGISWKSPPGHASAASLWPAKLYDTPPNKWSIGRCFFNCQGLFFHLTLHLVPPEEHPGTPDMLLLPDVAKCGLAPLCALPTSCHSAGMEGLLFHSEGEFPALRQHRARENPAQDIIIVIIFQTLGRCLQMPGRGRSRGWVVTHGWEMHEDGRACWTK